MATVRVALIGTGGIARKHFEYLAGSPDVQIVAACDVSAEAVQAFYDRTRASAALPALPPAFTDTRAMYAATKPQAVVICTPHTLHFEQGVEALEHGCHVLMEKPMVTRADHAHRLKATVEQAGKVLTIGYNTPCSPEFDYLRTIIREHRFGRLELVSGWLSQGWFTGTRGTWRSDPALSGGGQAYDSGAHLLNSLCWSVESDIDSVFAFIDQRNSRVDINSAITIRFASGVLASIAIGGNCPTDAGTIEPHRWSSDLIFMFERGRVDIDGWNARYLRIWEGPNRVKYPPITKPALSPAQNFIDAILGRDQPRTTPRDGVVHSELMDAIYASARTGAPAAPQSPAAVRSSQPPPVREAAGRSSV